MALCTARIHSAVPAGDSSILATDSCSDQAGTKLRVLFKTVNDITCLFDRIMSRDHLHWLPSSITVASAAIPLALCSLNSNLMDMHLGPGDAWGWEDVSRAHQQRLLLTLMHVVQTSDMKLDGIDSVSTVINQTLNRISLYIRSSASLQLAVASKRNSNSPAWRASALDATISSLYLVAAKTMDSSFRNDRSIGGAVISMDLITGSVESAKQSVDMHCSPRGAEPSAQVYTTNPAAQVSEARLAQWIANDRSLHFACAMEGAAFEASDPDLLAGLEVGSDGEGSPVDSLEIDLASQAPGTQNHRLEMAWDHSGGAGFEDEFLWDFHGSSADDMALLGV